MLGGGPRRPPPSSGASALAVGRLPLAGPTAGPPARRPVAPAGASLPGTWWRAAGVGTGSPGGSLGSGGLRGARGVVPPTPSPPPARRLLPPPPRAAHFLPGKDSYGKLTLGEYARARLLGKPVKMPSRVVLPVPRRRRPKKGDSVDVRRQRYAECNARDWKPHLTYFVNEIRRVCKKTKNGRRTRFRVLVMAGDYCGTVGVGVGTSGDIRTAILKARRRAGRESVQAPLLPSGSFPFAMHAKHCGCKVHLNPHPWGDRLTAGVTIQKLLALAGITAGAAKQLRSGSRMNNLRAVVKALAFMTRGCEAAEARGAETGRWRGDALDLRRAGVTDLLHNPRLHIVRDLEPARLGFPGGYDEWREELDREWEAAAAAPPPPLSAERKLWRMKLRRKQRLEAEARARQREALERQWALDREAWPDRRLRRKERRRRERTRAREDEALGAPNRWLANAVPWDLPARRSLDRRENAAAPMRPELAPPRDPLPA